MTYRPPPARPPAGESLFDLTARAITLLDEAIPLEAVRLGLGRGPAAVEALRADPEAVDRVAEAVMAGVEHHASPVNRMGLAMAMPELVRRHATDALG